MASELRLRLLLHLSMLPRGIRRKKVLLIPIDERSFLSIFSLQALAKYGPDLEVAPYSSHQHHHHPHEQTGETDQCQWDTVEDKKPQVERDSLVPIQGCEDHRDHEHNENTQRPHDPNHTDLIKAGAAANSPTNVAPVVSVRRTSWYVPISSVGPVNATTLLRLLRPKI